MATPQPVLQFDVPRPQRSSRLLNGLLIIKEIAAIPHLIVLSLLGFVVSITTSLAWLAILFTGKYPRGMWNLAVMYLRWQANLGAYLGMMRDEYPPFGDGQYAVTFQLDYPQRLSRWKIFFKGLFIIPHWIVLAFVGIATYVTTILAWFAVLITGRYPAGLFSFNVGVLRWLYRVEVYLFLLTDAYPPFSMAPLPSPTAGYASSAA